MEDKNKGRRTGEGREHNKKDRREVVGKFSEKKIFTRRKPIWEVKERGRDGEREREINLGS